ncbi:MBL fold metallo-hydrolase [Desulfuromonas versatilis]|uniref:MBL fold metallo-hydrolase n=1 Tax=Desulfuromonas versatilis TaxID=2802975 RepID=A0ABN6E311_9BACT|nr:MBL fold metallo-hydrolase [Desulfuromonas versatilis]BCR05546.1 MBL fold metallo-hydrolase [Desulfuromonas versatilis]
MNPEILPVGPLQVNCAIFSCPETGEAMIIDPGDDGERILELVRRAGLQVKLIVNTHGHFDHVGANRLLVEKTGAPLLIHALDVPLLQRAVEHAALYGLKAVPSPEPERTLNDGEVLSLGTRRVEVIHTPGHSPGGICLLAGNHLFSGDSLFAGSIGRTDLPGGDHALLVAKVRQKLLVLPGETIVHPGHGPDTTIAREKASNPFVGDRA